MCAHVYACLCRPHNLGRCRPSRAVGHVALAQLLVSLPGSYLVRLPDSIHVPTGLKCEHSSVAATVENRSCGHALIKLRCTHLARHGELGCACRGGRRTHFSCRGRSGRYSGRGCGCMRRSRARHDDLGCMSSQYDLERLSVPRIVYGPWR